MADTREFNAVIAALPTRTIVVGHLADGTAITTEVHSLFGGPQ